MQTTACWWTLPDDMETRYDKEALKSAMVGLAHLMRGIAPAYLGCVRPRTFPWSITSATPSPASPRSTSTTAFPGASGFRTRYTKWTANF